MAPSRLLNSSILPSRLTMKRLLFPALASLLCVPASAFAQAPMPLKKVQFSRDVLPILSTHCLTCHGPDDKARKAGLRLDLAETALRTLKSGSRAVVPGDIKNSELIAR